MLTRQPGFGPLSPSSLRGSNLVTPTRRAGYLVRCLRLHPQGIHCYCTHPYQGPFQGQFHRCICQSCDRIPIADIWLRSASPMARIDGPKFLSCGHCPSLDVCLSTILMSRKTTIQTVLDRLWRLHLPEIPPIFEFKTVHFGHGSLDGLDL